jgi:poly(ADP-ribose) glycohydrolase
LTPLSQIDLRTEGTIEACRGALQVDFANKHLGGGVLRGGCAQEEIRFGICSPECIAGLLFCEDMEPNEAIAIDGAEQFSTYTGYGRSVKWAGDFRDTTERDADGSVRVTIIAIDALMFPM